MPDICADNSVYPLELHEAPVAGGANDGLRPVRVRLVRAGRTVAGVTVVPAELEPFAGRGPAQLARSVLLRDLEGEDTGLAPVLYMALRRGRIWGRHTVAACGEGPQVQALALEPMDPAPAPRYRAQRVDLAIHRAYAACDPTGRALCQRHMLPEAVETLAGHARRFGDTAWARAVRARRLSRAQYMATLANTHQYVRFTPRLLARAIAVSDDEGLREHFLRHLDGERRHDLLLEADLRELGADVEFVRERMTPAPATLQFMLVQESMIGFHQDPVLFMAAPFVAEGLAGGVDPGLLVDLAENIRAWGVEPRLVTRFLRSHVHLDGGADGHWALTCALLARHLADERVHQRFLGALHLAAEAFHRSYDAYIDDLSIFSPPALELYS